MKKRFLFAALFVFTTVYSFSETYRIKNSEYDISGTGSKLMGKTREYPFKRNFPLDTRTIFPDRESLEVYLQNYKLSIESSRLFDEVEIDYEAILSQNGESEEDDFYEVVLMTKLTDAHHLLVMPYPKYSSNDGISLKLKAKDSNFIGSLNTMNTEVELRYKEGVFQPKFAFDFDAPFGLGPFDAVFVNDYSLSYVLSENDKGFEWDTKTGLKLALPFNRCSFEMAFYQYTHRELDYKEYDDEIYFSERFEMGLPVRLVTLKNFSDITYSPSVSVEWNWDFDGINKENDDLSGPELSFSHSISNSKITWNDNFRKGYSWSLDNSFTYNIQRGDLVPEVSAEGKFYWNYKANDEEIWNRFGICTDLYAFYYFDLPSNTYKYGSKIGSRLRGILDESYFGNEKPAYTASSAIVFNLDLPHNVFTAYFPKEVLNFNCQFSPFFDMALVYDRATDRYFAFEDGFYCAGFEMLLYPLRWPSFTIRASLGIDLRSNFLVEGLKGNKEIFIGIGLHY